ncbi:MAG: hypothetical protein JXD19_02225 [Deltaproteobacteria bacterium]|nr:hypothetical protein [Deltaproteobacteria bacterium]
MLFDGPSNQYPCFSIWVQRQYDSSDDRYHECPRVPDMQPGLAYWLVAKKRVIIDAQGWPAPTDTDFIVTLPPGMFQLGCPFYFPVNWNNVRVKNGNIIVPIGGPANEWISTRLLKYEAGRYIMVDTLEPWSGYWVENLSDETVELLIPPVMSVE